MKLSPLFLIFFLFIIKVSHTQIESTEVKRDKLDSLVWLDNTYVLAGEIISSLFVRSDIVTQYHSVLTNEERATWYTKLGESYFYLGESILAIEYLKKSINIKESKVKMHSNEMIARAFIKIEELDSAQFYHAIGLKLATNNIDKIRIRNSTGYTFFLKSEFMLAKENYNIALDEFSKWEKKDSIQFYIIQSNLVSLAIAQEDNDEALQLIENIKGWSAFKSCGHWFVLEVLYKELGIAMGNQECMKSRAILLDIIEVVDTSVSNSEQIHCIATQIDLTILCGDKAELSQLIQFYIELSNKFSKERDKSIMVIEEIQRKNQNYQNEILELNYSLKLNENNIMLVSNRRRSQLIILSVIITGIVFLMGLLWLRFKRKQQVKREKYLNVKNELLTERNLSSELQLTLRNKEIETRKLELQSVISGMDINSDLFKEISNRLGAIKIQSSKAKSEIQQLIMFIKGKVNYEMIDEVLRTHEDLIQADFKARLLEQFPALTTSELQLLVLVRMQLTNHEMAQLKNVEASSIRTLKYRLKKKMGIDKDKSLIDFLTVI